MYAVLFKSNYCLIYCLITLVIIRWSGVRGSDDDDDEDPYTTTDPKKREPSPCESKVR